MTSPPTGKDLDVVRAELTAAVEALGAAPGLDTYVARGADLDAAAISRVEFAADLAAAVTLDLMAALAGLLDRELVPYDPSYQPAAGQALVADLGDTASLQRIHTSVLSDDVPIDDAAGGAVHAMAHRLHREGAAVAAYRVKGAGIATRRPRGLWALLPRDGVYARVDDEILYYEPRVDAWAVGDHVLFTARTTLEQRLHAPGQAQEMARETFVRATVDVVIDGAAKLAAACATDPAMIAKMASLARTLEADPGYAAQLTTQRLVSFVEANPHFGVRVDGSGDERRLVFEPAAQTRYRIVKLLADDFLRSDLTQRRYAAGSKQRMTGG